MFNFLSRGPFAGSASPMSATSSASTLTGPGLGSTRSIGAGATSTNASTSTLLNNDDANAFLDIDTETSTVIAELLYSDLQELASQRKGKSRYNAPLSDSEYALQLQSEHLEGMLTQMQDAEIAKRMQNAMRMDQALIEQMVLNEQVARQDHEAALALSRGEQLPGLTEEQRAIERGAKTGRDALSMDMLEVLSPRLRPTSDSALDKGKNKAVSFSPSDSSVRLPGLDLRVPNERCDDRIPIGKLSLKAPCDHYYCMDCLASLVRAATTDESLFPVRCCRKNIPAEILTRYLSKALLTTFQAKAKEFGTPADARVYCCVPTCSAFLGNAEEAKRNRTLDWAALYWASPDSPAKLQCDKCWVETCVECRQRTHPNNTCQQNGAADQVKDLARAQGWQTCPSCKRIIELAFGCNHMTCYRGYEFCYECAARWKTCGCEQWEERRLYATAEARMEREYGEQARVERPVEWGREVQAFAQNLRVNHECFPTHRWGGHGPGVCEECGMYMRVFLKTCKECRLTVCRRCSNNRL
ncbi:hypothetical protein D9756_007983 [Leucocoprinus leucothites]|uniref:RBR-type E3 ubiquitin transferase n=1 Tax=Leucocoprinus leucothites TaxID=201217 RepID=A0A8H5FXZ8_9AGAR|nr:hypothetical protein D9756_007983 [Leucoagaricus leucothites]